MAIFIDDIDLNRRDTRVSGSPSPDVAIGEGGTPIRPDSALEVEDVAPESRRQGQFERDIDWARESRLQFDQLRIRDEQVKQAQERTKPEWRELWGASFALENTLGSLMAYELTPSVPPMEGYSPFDVADDGSSDIDGFEQFAPLFADSQHPDTTAAIKRRIEKEHKRRQILANAPVRGFLTSIAAGVVDPINLSLMAIPVAGQARIGTTMATAAGSSAVVEAGLHQTQLTRTLDESLVNTAGSALLSGVLGGAINALTRSQRAQLERNIVNQVLRDEEPSVRTSDTEIETPGPRPDNTGSVGAMAASSFDAEIVMNGPLTKMAATMAKITPLGRTIQSPNLTVRQTAAQLVDSRIEMQGDYRPTSVESLIRLDYARFDTATLKVRDFQRDWSDATGYDGADFSRELIRAMRRGDESMYPQVQQAAQALRAEMNNLWNKAYELELPGTGRMIPDGEGGEVRAPIETTTAQSYMTRRYDLNVVRNNPERFKRAWMTGIKEQRMRNGDEPMSNDDLYEVATNIYENIINLRDGDLHFQVGPSGAAMLRERVDVRDEFLEEFLVQDWEELMIGYVKSLAPRVRLAETFGDGEWNMKSVLDKINNEYSLQINNLDRRIDRTTGKEKNKLVRERDSIIKKMEADMRDIEIMRDRLLNIAQDPSYMNPENRGILSALRTARSWNIATSLSNIVVASIPDLARVLTYHGGGKVVRGLARSAFSREIQRGTIPKNEMARVASAMERASHYRMAHLTEVEDGIVYTRADKYAHKVADMAMTASGSKHWNSVLKSIVGHLYSDRITRALQSETPANTRLLRQAGLTDDMIAIARQEARTNATDDDGLWNLNLDRWGNRELVENLEAAAIREAEGIIVTPGAGDKPLTMTTEVGRTLFQFMSFMMASTNKTLLPLMQERGGRKWLEILTHIGLGSAVYMLREVLSGRDPSTNPEEILLRGVENTGLAGYGMELYRMGTGLTGLHPIEETGRFNQPVGVQRLLGPTAGLVDNALRIPHSSTSADARAKAARRLMPMQNHYLLRHAYDSMEEQMAEMFGSESSTGQEF